VIIGKNLKGRVIKGPAFSYVYIMSIYCKMGNLLAPNSLAIFFSFLKSKKLSFPNYICIKAPFGAGSSFGKTAQKMRLEKGRKKEKKFP
jgi:hypothetical protein